MSDLSKLKSGKNQYEGKMLSVCRQMTQLIDRIWEHISCWWW